MWPIETLVVDVPQETSGKVIELAYPAVRRIAGNGNRKGDFATPKFKIPQEDWIG